MCKKIVFLIKNYTKKELLKEVEKIQMIKVWMKRAAAAGMAVCLAAGATGCDGNGKKGTGGDPGL